MRGGVYNPLRVQLVHVTPVSYLILAGANGWIDTDVSAQTGTIVSRIWLVSANPSGSQLCGARALGETIEPNANLNNSGLFLSRVGDTGHMDLFRSVANCTYTIIGYLL